MKKKRKRKGKLEAQETQWPVPSGVKEVSRRR